MFHLRGCCPRGNACGFAHGEAQLRTVGGVRGLDCFCYLCWTGIREGRWLKTRGRAPTGCLPAVAIALTQYRIRIVTVYLVTFPATKSIAITPHHLPPRIGIASAGDAGGPQAAQPHPLRPPL